MVSEEIKIFVVNMFALFLYLWGEKTSPLRSFDTILRLTVFASR